MVKRAQWVLLAAALPLLTAACSVSFHLGAATGNDTDGMMPSAPSTALPMSHAMAKRLPAGTFYFLAGPKNISSNIWEVSRTGRETRLTRNGPNFGISNFGASTAGVVMGDGAGGGDVLAALTAKGPIELKNPGDGDSPAINAAGQLCYVKQIYGKNGAVAGQRLIVRNSLNGPGRVAYKVQASDTMAGMLECQWGPDGSIAVLIGGHYPGAPGPESKLVTVGKTGKAARVRTGADARLGAVIWSEQGGGIAVGVTAGRGVVIDSADRRYSLPAGWFPKSWSPAGTRLLVYNYAKSQLGLWSAAAPRSVEVIGTTAKQVLIGDVIWLPRPAKRWTAPKSATAPAPWPQ